MPPHSPCYPDDARRVLFWSIQVYSAFSCYYNNIKMMQQKSMSVKHSGKYVFVTGGVCSSLGKGIAASSIGCLLEMCGYAVQMMKIDPYINVDAGTMSPYQHGEVYVTDDKTETDLDLGNYERFTSAPMSKNNSITTGQIYQEVIQSEREGRYLGRTVQVIPHISDCIKARILRVGSTAEVDITIIEVGGTVGDIESFPFLEAIRQIIHDKPHDTCTVHLTLLPDLSNGELKTKPTQHSIKELRSVGIHPDCIMCRSESPVSEEYLSKIERSSDVRRDGVISAHNETPIYNIPFLYEKQKVDVLILRRLSLPVRSKIAERVNKWKHVVNTYKNAERTVTIGMVGKYVELSDAYRSVDEALIHGGIKNKVKVRIVKIDSESLEKKRKETQEVLDELNGILVPGGFGSRGTLGMIYAAEWARTHNMPYFGICLGLQIMVIEYARNLLNLKDADSTEFRPETKHPVISLLSEQENVVGYGASMRLGANVSVLKEGSIIYQLYGKKNISERHRHRYEISSKFIESLESAGLMATGKTQDGSLVESVEWHNHRWGIGVQFHPEFTSRPIKPHPLFSGFVKACLEK